GGSKTVSTASLSHAFRAHPQLLFEDLRILAIDFDPQASLTMFLSHENSVGLVENMAAQAMLQNVSREELLSDFIVPSIIPG
ncbi:ParA family protein, partial [Salmonella enterica subsp. enterica serovar Panama]|uniref:ParA family protein n=1 Tax=Salmonella enterica TaxID=28901 RepID=UPI00119264A5